ncbi:MAG TPA: hypothetical protein VMF87_36030 [Streptosporangiaceae bacterium]|nr:hypothetical protein [Streptosporangiaceae bacterium]
MHPDLTNQMARQHAADMRAVAERARLVRRPRVVRTSVRHRAGWTLVEIGLRLAGTSGGA